MSKRKLVSPSDKPNSEFCEILNELSVYERTVANNAFKANAYRKAATIISKHPTKLTSGQEAMKLPGVGKQIGLKLDEFLQSGSLQKLDKIKKDDTSQAITELTRVSGIGPASARKFVTEHKINSIDDLRKNTALLNNHQQIGLKYLEELEERIPRDEVDKWKKLIFKNIAEVDEQFTMEICGSYRRGASSCGDVDVLVTHPQFQTVASPDKKKAESLLRSISSNLVSQKLITDVLALGESKLAAVIKLPNNPSSKHRRLDIRLIAAEQYPFALLYFTGSDVFNKNMRAHALEKGFTLNEYSIRPVGSTGVAGDAIKVEKESEIFEIIDFPHKKPEDRSQ